MTGTDMEKAIAAHKREYETQPDVVVSAPGRVHLLGEHSWYFKDKTLSMAVNLPVYLVVSLRADSAIRFWFPQLNERKRVVLASMKYRKEDRWANVIKGVIFSFMTAGYECRGMNITVYSDILPQAGFGITTAMKVASAGAMRAVYDPKLSDMDLVHFIEQANKSFLGVTGFLSDIYTALFAKKGTCLVTNCNDSSFAHVPFEFPEVNILLTDAHVPRATVWNEKSLWTPEFACLLGDLKITRNGIIMYEESDDEINEILEGVNEEYRRRLICIMKEQHLLLDALDALKSANFTNFARAVMKSHELLRDMFSISCPEVDWLVKRVQELDSLTGIRSVACARITGKGFATYTMIRAQDEELYTKKLTEYERIFGFHPMWYPVQTAEGMRVLQSRLNE